MMVNRSLASGSDREQSPDIDDGVPRSRVIEASLCGEFGRK
jgi:hypothetical protein